MIGGRMWPVIGKSDNKLEHYRMSFDLIRRVGVL